MSFVARLTGLARGRVGVFARGRSDSPLPLPLPGSLPEGWRLEALLAFLGDHLPARPAILDTAPGVFTPELLRLEPSELISVAPDPELFERIHASCARQGICTRPHDIHLDEARWVLPRLTARVRERAGRFDLVRLGQCEAWPFASLELVHAGALLRRGGYLMVDGLRSRPGAAAPTRGVEPPGYRLILELGSALVFEKTCHAASLHGWERRGALVLA